MKIDLKHCRFFAREKGGEIREFTNWLYFFEEESIQEAADVGNGMASCWEEIWIEAESPQPPNNPD